MCNKIKDTNPKSMYTDDHLKLAELERQDNSVILTFEYSHIVPTVFLPQLFGSFNCHMRLKKLKDEKLES